MFLCQSKFQLHPLFLVDKLKAVFLFIFLSFSNDFGNAPAIRFNGKDIIVAIMKNSIMMPMDLYWNPNIFIIDLPIKAIIDNIIYTPFQLILIYYIIILKDLINKKSIIVYKKRRYFYRPFLC